MYAEMGSVRHDVQETDSRIVVRACRECVIHVESVMCGSGAVERKKGVSEERMARKVEVCVQRKDSVVNGLRGCGRRGRIRE